MKPTIRLLSLLLLIYAFRLLLPLNPQIIRFHGDEAIISRNALEMFKKGIPNKNWNLLGSEGGPISRFPSLWYFLQGAVIYFLGPSLPSLKFFSLVTDFGIAVLLYLITKAYFSHKTAIATVLLYSTFPISIHFSLTGYQNIQSTFFLLLTFFLLTFTRKTKIPPKNTIFIFAGITAGLSMYFYLSSVLIPILSLTFLFYWYRSQKKILVKNSLSFLLGFVPAIGPFFYHSLTQYNFLTGRSSALSLSTDTAITTREIIVNQITHFFKGFHAGSMNGSGMHYVNLPLFPNLLVFSFFLLGFFYALFKWKKKGHLELLAIFCCTSLTGGLLTEAPPAPQRLIHLFPLSIIFVVLGINLLFKSSKKAKLPYVLIILLLFGLNIFSFLTQNILQNKEILKPEYFFYKYYSQHSYNYPVYAHIPKHLLPQIYFHSKGKIDPQFIHSSPEFLSVAKPFLFLTDQNGLNFLDKNPSLEFTQLDWNHPEKHLTGYQLFLVGNSP